MAWAPLLDGDLRARATSTIEEIARALDREAPDASLGRGSSGVALLFGYLDPGGPEAERHFDRALAATAAAATPPSLHRGFVGVGWVGTHLGLLDPDDDELDQAITASLGDWGELDLMNGLAGLLVHVRERLPRPGASETALRIVEALAARLDTWAGPRSLLGVAHGIAGIASAMIHAGAGARARQVTMTALERALVRLPELARVPVFGWCHADIGFGAALLAMARTLGDLTLEQTAVAIARDAAGRHRHAEVVRDASFCHGAAGLGHLFNRIYQATGDPSCADAARHWFARALELRTDRGIGGYRAWIAATGKELDWHDEVGVVHGAAGVALALLAATSDREPAWDRAFALS